MARYSLFVLKVPLNNKKPNQTYRPTAAVKSQHLHTCRSRDH